MQPALSTTANAAIPAGAYRRRVAVDQAGVTGHAAGVLFVAPDGDILLLRRSSAEGNYAGHWALPGGGVEPGETPELGADREVQEEIGSAPGAGNKKLLDQRRTPTGMVFHTFAQPVAAKFAPKLNDEHTGYAWAPLGMLPRPLHPAVERTLTERIGAADAMKPEEFKGVCDEFVKWSREPAAYGATDSAMMALDRDSVRAMDRDGRMRIAITNISKATVNPYRGHEIPNYEALGLDPNRIYQLLRDPEELEKAAGSSNGVQLLRKHIPVSADDPQQWDVVGATGTDALYEAPYLKNSLIIWTKDAIEDVLSENKKELSCGYHYRPDMTPGVYDGKNYDGVMRDLVFNHIALVKDGRAGPDVVVGDSNEEIAMSQQDAATRKVKAIANRTVSIGALTTFLKPRLAMDAKIDMGEIFKGVTGTTFAAKRGEIVSRLNAQAKGKLAQDADLKDVEKVLEMLEKHEVTGGDEEVSAMENNTIADASPGMVDLPKTTVAGASDAEGLRGFLKEKGMGEDDITKACGLVGPKAADETPEEKEKREKAEKEKTAKDEAEKAEKDKKDKEAMDNMVTKPAMDAALKAVAEATAKNVRETERGIREALGEVRDYVGELPASMAFDSGDDVRRHALGLLGVPEAKTIHASALKTVLGLQRKAGAHAPDINGPSPIAMDAAAEKSFAERFPGADRIQTAL